MYKFNRKPKGTKSWAYGVPRLKGLRIKGSRNGTTASVYVFSLGEPGRYKVGISGNVLERMISLRAGNPDIREVFSYRVPNARKCERHIHAAFRVQRVDREVYDLNREDVEAIRKYLDEYQSKPDPSTTVLFKYIKHRDIQMGSVL